MKKKKELRRLLELAYLHAWGSLGSVKLRGEWLELSKSFNVGKLIYTGVGEFIWVEK